MAKIYVSYKIETIVEGIVKPGDELKGKVFIRSEEKKEQKLKYVGVEVTENYEHDVPQKDYQTGGTRMVNVVECKTIKKFDVYQGGEKLEPGDTKEFDFIVKLPNFPGKKHRDWYISLDFKQKTGLFSSTGKDENEAVCILPVPGSDRVPAIGSLQAMK